MRRFTPFVLSFVLALISTLHAQAQDCSTCSAEVQASLADNAQYQAYINEGTQSGTYKASRMIYRATLAQCGSCLSSTEIDAINEMISQLDQAIGSLATDNSYPTYDASGTNKSSGPSSTQERSLQPRPTPTTTGSSGSRTMHAGVAN